MEFPNSVQVKKINTIKDTTKHHYDINVTSFHDIAFSKIAYALEHNINYQLAKFQKPRVPGSNFTWGGGEYQPPPRLIHSIKAQSYRVKITLRN